MDGSRTSALITGASSGIGRELAKLFAHDRHNLVLVARNRDALAALAKEIEAANGISTKIIAKDLSNSEAPREIFEEVNREGIVVSVLVNCAGFGTSGAFSEVDWVKESDMIQVNLTALTHLTKLFLDGMLQRHDGKIMNVASTAAFEAGPYMSVYHATKAYVLHFTEALSYELRNSGITATALCPGPTKTGFQETATIAESRLFKGSAMDSETVARSGYRGLMAGKRLVIPGLRNQLSIFALRLLPRSAVTSVVAGLYRNP